MIGQIRNPWIRRPIVVLTFIPFLILTAAFGAAILIAEDFTSTIRHAWKGPAA